ncbi:type II toxin-antitoxin system HicB family antitoxin [Candidatus Babeliales bacterium]|nr:type II toxin-antitoxin system HicB family antitoxin [Candidatus Babeliales bacterium]
MNYHFKIHKEGKGFWAQCIELEGCITQADNLKKLKENMQEALNLYIEEADDVQDLALLPDKSIKLKKNVIEVPVDPKIAFAFLVRFYRIKYGMTQQEAARKLGFSNIYSYQRLEKRRSNPRLETIVLLKKLFPEFSIDYVL